MNLHKQWRGLALAGFVAWPGFGCASYREISPTANLWQQDNTGTIEEHAGHTKYIYGIWTRATLTPLAVTGDAAVIGVMLGTGGMLMLLADKCGAEWH